MRTIRGKAVSEYRDTTIINRRQYETHIEKVPQQPRKCAVHGA